MFKLFHMKVFYLIIILSISFNISAQTNIEFNKENFADNIANFKTAKKALKTGDIQFSAEKYELAYKNYTVANNINPDNAELNLKIGICCYYLNIDSIFNKNSIGK